MEVEIKCSTYFPYSAFSEALWPIHASLTDRNTHTNNVSIFTLSLVFYKELEAGVPAYSAKRSNIIGLSEDLTELIIMVLLVQQYHATFDERNIFDMETSCSLSNKNLRTLDV